MDIKRRHYFNNQLLIKTYGCWAPEDHQDSRLDDRDINEIIITGRVQMESYNKIDRWSEINRLRNR